MIIFVSVCICLFLLVLVWLHIAFQVYNSELVCLHVFLMSASSSPSSRRAQPANYAASKCLTLPSQIFSIHSTFELQSNKEQSRCVNYRTNTEQHRTLWAWFRWRAYDSLCISIATLRFEFKVNYGNSVWLSRDHKLFPTETAVAVIVDVGVKTVFVFVVIVAIVPNRRRRTRRHSRGWCGDSGR